MSKEVLLISNSYEPVSEINWKKAVKLILSGKAELIKEYDDKFLHTSKTMFKMPAVVRLNNPFDRPRRRINFNRKNIWIRDRYKCQYCLTPDHLVLTRDLKWIPLGDLNIGDTLISFEENANFGHARKFCESIIESYFMESDYVYSVILDDETKFKTTADHLWLGKYSLSSKLKWFATKDLQNKFVPRLFTPWAIDNSYEAGWLSGLYDGEGWLRKTRNGITPSIGQNPGLVLDMLKKELVSKGFNISSSIINIGKLCERIRICGNIGDKAKFLGQIRPQRLLNTFSPDLLGIVKSGIYHKIISIELIGKMDIVKVKTSSSTIIVEGFPQHNCGGKFSGKELTLDHVVPRAQGGKTCWENIVACCKDCNDKKKNRTPAQANMKLKRIPVKPDWRIMGSLASSPPSSIPESWKSFLFLQDE